jgi:hypothetical protein
MRVAALVLAILAGVIGLPGAACSGVCVGMMAGAMESDPEVGLTAEEEDGMAAIAGVFMCSGLIGALLYVVGGGLVLVKGPAAGIVCVIASLLTAVTILSFNPLAILSLLLGLVATVLAFLRKHPASASE